MRLILLLTISIIGFSLFSYGQCVTNVDFNTWSQGGFPGNGNWVIRSGGSEIEQTINGSPTFYISPQELINVRISGSFRCDDQPDWLGGDDDWMGFVFSYLDPLGASNDFDCWLFDWKKEDQGARPRGMALNRVNGTINNYGPGFNNHTNSPEFTVVQNDFGGPGWNEGTTYNFDLYLTYNRATIYVDGNLIFDHIDCYSPGRFGFYNLSQDQVTYSNFQYDIYIDFLPEDDGKVCVGSPIDLQFVNPCQVVSLAQYQNITWDFGDGSPQQIINNPTFTNANASHNYQTPGTYTVTLTVTDIYNCSGTATKTIEVRDPISLTPTFNQPPCNGGLNGSIAVNTSGGFGNYSYNWSGGNNNLSSITGIGAGTYMVTVTDSICTTIGQYTLNQPTALTASTSHIDATCGNNDGSVSITISGGTPPYQGISWAGIPGATRTGLGAGYYIADFQDANGCSALLQYRETIVELPCGINSSVSVSNVSCFGGNDGNATLTVTGSTGTPVITWSSGDTGPTAIGLPAGTYTYNYSDSDPNHSFSGSVTINEPGAPMVINVDSIAISCANSNDGQAIASVISGGTPPYVFNWSGGQPNDPVASGLAPGSISVTVTDLFGCSATGSTTISGVPSLSSSVNTVIDSCYRSGKGSATVSVSGGTPPYDYEWDDASTNPTNYNLYAGTYTVTITDNNGCDIIETAIINGPSTALSSTYNRTDVLCNGDNTGSFDVTGNGGTPGYTYEWNPSSLTGNNPTNLAAGIYKYTITDAFGCVAFGGDTIFEPDTALYVQADVTDVSCNGGNDGSVTLTIGGGTPPYNYLGNPIPGGTTTIPGLSAGVYGGVLTDANNCSITVSDTVFEPSLLTSQMGTVDDSCYLAGNGSATIYVFGGTRPYSYNWDNSGTDSTINNLVAGTYYVTVTDSNGCTLIDSAIIGGPNSIVSSSSTSTDVLCFGDNTGSINVTATGGTPGYTYQWNPSSLSGNNPSSLTAGIYSYTVTDAFNCVAFGQDTVLEPDSALYVNSVVTDVTCNGANNGEITLTVGGGTPPYSYLGNPIPAGTTTLGSLPPGTYGGTLTDANGCSVTVSETITEPGPQSISVTSTDNPCFGANQGTASASVTNPTGTVTYDWTGGLNGANIASLESGTYTVTATDQNGCTWIDSVIITSPAPDTVAVTATDATCFGSNGSATAATPATGTPPYTYNWSDNSVGQTVALPAGNYTLTVLGANGCGSFGSTTINEPTEISISAQLTDISCFGEDNGSITLTVTGGDGPNYTYSWNPNVSNTNTAIDLAGGTYSITITDQSNCTKDTSFTINEPSPINLSAIGEDLDCFEDGSGVITANSAGGVTPINYTLIENNAIVGSSNNGDFQNLDAGNYTIVAIDANSCTDTTDLIIAQPNELVIIANSSDISCYGAGDGSVNTAISGGTATYNYELSNGDQNNSGSFNNLEAGSYTITTTDANGCVITETFSIVEPDELFVTVSPDSLFVDAGRELELNASVNQNGDFNYYWEPDTGLTCSDCPDPIFESVLSGFYVVTATDSNGCSVSEEVYITVIPNYDMFIPNAFSPNGDGENDTWKLFGNIEGLKLMKVFLFDRWGEMVFTSDDPNFEWDGTHNGNVLPPDVFVWRVRLVFYDGYTTTLKGSLTLIR